MPDGYTFASDKLAAALTRALKLRPWRPPDRSSYPPQPAIRLTPRPGGATIISATPEMSIAVDVQGEVSTQSIALPCDAFAAAVGKAPKGAQVALTATTSGALFTAGRMRANLQVDQQQLLAERPQPAGEPIVVAVASLREGLGQTSPAIAKDLRQPVLGGVYMHDIAGVLGFAAMDGNRVHARAAMDGNRVHARALLPQALVDLLLATLPDDGDATIRIDERTIQVEAGGATIRSGILIGTFPDFERELQRGTDRVLRARRASELLADLEMVAVVAEPRDHDIRLDLGQTATASAFRQAGNGYTRASGQVDLEVEFAGAPLAIGFQMRLVRDALSQFGDRPIEWALGGPHDASIIASADAPGLRILVSPFLLRSTHMLEAA